MKKYALKMIPSIQAVQWNGNNYYDILGIAGKDRSTPAHAGRMFVQVTGGAWVELCPGYWVSRGDDGEIRVHSDEAFNWLFREEV